MSRKGLEMKIVFFNRSLMSGGIEKCIELLSEYLYEDNKIEIVFSHTDKLDMHIVDRFKKYAEVTMLENKVIECDLCIFCNIYFDEKIMDQIKANKYFLWIHSKPREMPNCVLDNKKIVDRIDKFICVSQEVKNELHIDDGRVSVIHNFINQNIQELANERNPFENIRDDTLKLVVVSRLSTGKGFERVELLVQALEQSEISYKLKIVGKGRAKEQEIRVNLGKYKGVEFEGYQDNPYCYIKNADYLIQLSDYESWGNVITEAKALQVPCVVTDFPSAKEQIQDGTNGIIVKRKMENYENIVIRMVKEKQILKQNLKNFEYTNEIQKWRNIIQIK